MDSTREDGALVHVKAAELLAGLHDALEANSYANHALEVFLVRTMFCLFADHTGIFARKHHFRLYMEQKTNRDGSDVGFHLNRLFATLDTPIDRRQRERDEELAALPYVNARLFETRVDPPTFDTQSRERLLQCCTFDWSAVSPAIFGSMFQFVMDKDRSRRRNLGVHYTSDKNILKLIGPLFLDDWRCEAENATNPDELQSLLSRIAAVKLLDPACGCGDFLIVAYRELRRLEIDIHRKLRGWPGSNGDTAFAKGIGLDSLYGIEIEEFPAHIAEAALYLVDHQMNAMVSQEFGQNLARRRLCKSPTIIHGNALQMDWDAVVPRDRLSYILGNPPFVGKKARTASQNRDMALAFGDRPRCGELDYVACWFAKAARFIRGTDIQVAFVATNSITQGEQVGILWPALLREGVKIHFAHRTFRWRNEAPGPAHVYCVIIGFASFEPSRTRLFDYPTPDSQPAEIPSKHINAYLVDCDDIFVLPRRTPITPSPPARFGNMPNDDGNYLMTESERVLFLNHEPGAEPLIRPFISSKEYMDNIPRWCLWLKDAPPSLINTLQAVQRRVRQVHEYRAASPRAATRELARFPALFGEIRQPTTDYILIPRHTSENRLYILMSIMSRDDIVGDSCIAVAPSDLYVLGVLMSAMHMAWVRQVGGRLEGRYRYSTEIVYNNFSWPFEATDDQKQLVRGHAQTVLDVRARYPGESLKNLYDPLTMPGDILDAHRQLDQAVDACYRPSRFNGDSDRLVLLFDRFRHHLNGGQMEMLATNDPVKPRQRSSPK
jgi:hypothetical protein